MKIREHLASNPIRAFALLCVAATSAFLAVLAWRLVNVLSSPEWCSKALQAERISTERGGGLTSCVDLLTIQLKSLALNSHIVIGTFALCLGVLIVIVIAGARLSGKLLGNELAVSRDVEAAANHVVDGAQEAANEIKGG